MLTFSMSWDDQTVNSIEGSLPEEFVDNNDKKEFGKGKGGSGHTALYVRNPVNLGFLKALAVPWRCLPGRGDLPHGDVEGRQVSMST